MTRVPQLPLEWLRHCKDMKEYASGDVEEIAITHAENMELAGKCRVRHNATVDRLKELDANP